MTDDDEWIGMFRASEWLSASEDAREIVSLMLMADEQGLSRDGIAQERVKNYTMPRQYLALITVLAESVSSTFETLEEFSENIITALAERSGE